MSNLTPDQQKELFEHFMRGWTIRSLANQYEISVYDAERYIRGEAQTEILRIEKEMGI